MSVRLTIGQNTIDFPSSGADPSWAQAVIDFAKATATQLAATASAFDVPPIVQVLTSDANTYNLTNAIFPSASVRSFSLYYCIYRKNGATPSNAFVQQGEVRGVYNTLSGAWTLFDQFNGDKQANGLPYQSFAMSGDQLQFTTIAVGGTYDTVLSTISFSAKTELKTQ